MKVNILGTKYKIKYQTDEENSILEQADGYCDKTTKEIIIRKFGKDEINLGKPKWYINKVIRHEIIHAFCFESGLHENANWDTEQMVDWFAVQGPKIFKIYEQLEILE